MKVRSCLFLVLCLSGPLVYGNSAQIIPEHPRLFFRAQEWGAHGLTVETVRDRMQDPSANAVLSQLGDSLPNLAPGRRRMNDTPRSRHGDRTRD